MQNIEQYENIILKHQSLEKMSLDPKNLPILLFSMPYLIQNLNKQLSQNDKITRYEVYELFFNYYAKYSL